jgi:hypothetical protein
MSALLPSVTVQYVFTPGTPLEASSASRSSGLGAGYRLNCYAVCCMPYAACYMLHMHMLYAICNMLYAVCYMQYAICYMLYAICYMLYAICYMLPATCYMVHMLYAIWVLPLAQWACA